MSRKTTKKQFGKIKVKETKSFPPHLHPFHANPRMPSINEKIDGNIHKRRAQWGIDEASLPPSMIFIIALATARTEGFQETTALDIY